MSMCRGGLAIVTIILQKSPGIKASNSNSTLPSCRKLPSPRLWQTGGVPSGFLEETLTQKRHSLLLTHSCPSKFKGTLSWAFQDHLQFLKTYSGPRKGQHGKETRKVKGQAERPHERREDTRVQDRRWKPAPYLNKAFRVIWTQPQGWYFPSQFNMLEVVCTATTHYLNSYPENSHSSGLAGHAADCLNGLCPGVGTTLGKGLDANRWNSLLKLAVWIPSWK